MSNLTILNAKVRKFDNLFCLNDLHRISGNESKHQPTFFVLLDTTQELLAELQQEDPNHTPIKSVNGGKMRGTYAMEEIALAYAMWISPKFHLVVLRAFLAMHRNEPKQLALPTPTINREFKDVMMKILNYAMHYEQFQKSIVSSEKEKRQKQIEFLFSEIPDGDGYLFVFRQEISQDIQKASDLLFALNFS